MRNNTVFYYILSGSTYYELIKNKENIKKVKSEYEKEIEYFFNKRFIRREKWFGKYLNILIAVFTVNLLARKYERFLSKKCKFLSDKYSVTAPSTLLALKTFNKNRKYFNIKVDNFIFLKDLIGLIYERVESFCEKVGCQVSPNQFIHGKTSIGIELEFSNKGAFAGRFFEPEGEDPLLNFSKYHYYHLTKFMWRFGAYVDSDIPFKQILKKGGFLEYTFTVPDRVFKPSGPLTNSPRLASELIYESVKFTPIKPHSLHVSLEVDKKIERLPTFSYSDAIFLLMVTGHFQVKNGGVVETRLLEKNMKEIAAPRFRKNKDGWVTTIEFTSMRLCRDFVRRKVYEPAINIFMAYKNLFYYPEVIQFANKLYDWAKKPHVKDGFEWKYFELVEKGLSSESGLPEWYREEMMEKIKNLYYYNKKVITGGV